MKSDSSVHLMPYSKVREELVAVLEDFIKYSMEEVASSVTMRSTPRTHLLERITQLSVQQGNATSFEERCRLENSGYEMFYEGISFMQRGDLDRQPHARRLKRVNKLMATFTTSLSESLVDQHDPGFIFFSGDLRATSPEERLQEFVRGISATPGNQNLRSQCFAFLVGDLNGEVETRINRLEMVTESLTQFINDITAGTTVHLFSIYKEVMGEREDLLPGLTDDEFNERLTKEFSKEYPGVTIDALIQDHEKKAHFLHRILPIDAWIQEEGRAISQSLEMSLNLEKPLDEIPLLKVNLDRLSAQATRNMNTIVENNLPLAFPEGQLTLGSMNKLCTDTLKKSGIAISRTGEDPRKI